MKKRKQAAANNTIRQPHCVTKQRINAAMLRLYFTIMYIKARLNYAVMQSAEQEILIFIKYHAKLIVED